MLKKQQYKEQRDNLGAHLKNTVNKVYQITDGISQVCKLARNGRLGKGKAFKEIEKLASELRNFNDVPANMLINFRLHVIGKILKLGNMKKKIILSLF